MSNLSKRDLVALAVSMLGGSSRSVSTEEVALKCFEIAPEQFSWQVTMNHICPCCNKPIQIAIPDKDSVRKSIGHAKITESNNRKPLIRGHESRRDSSKDGWQLTPYGARQIKKLKQSFIGNGRAIKRVPKQMERLINDIKSHKIFKQFQETKALSDSPSRNDEHNFLDMLESGLDTPKDIVTRKYHNLLLVAIESGDKELFRFTTKCAKTYGNFLDQDLLESLNV